MRTHRENQRQEDRCRQWCCATMPAVPPIAKLGSPFCSGGARAAGGAVGAVGLGEAEAGDDDVGDQLDVVDGVQGAINGVESIRERAEGNGAAGPWAMRNSKVRAGTGPATPAGA